MNNIYYVYHFGGKIEGPYTLEQAVKEKKNFDNICDWCRILKVVVDFTWESVE